MIEYLVDILETLTGYKPVAKILPELKIKGAICSWYGFLQEKDINEGFSLFLKISY